MAIFKVKEDVSNLDLSAGDLIYKANNVYRTGKDNSTIIPKEVFDSLIDRGVVSEVDIKERQKKGIFPFYL